MNKNILLGFALFVMPTLLSAQDKLDRDIDHNNIGVNFVEWDNFSKVVAAAKRENKYIFIDCYTTWCGPCKAMDRDVFSSANVASVLNKNFISIKAQMDSSKFDNVNIRKLYASVSNLKGKYPISAYPTFLFFTPDGRILNNKIGLSSADEFIKLAKSILDSNNNYYRILDSFKKGKRNVSDIRLLARTSLKLLNDTSQYETIIREYQLSLKDDDWVVRDNIEFMREFLVQNSNDVGFKIFYKFSDSINRIMKNVNYSQMSVSNVIYREIAFPEILKYKDSINGSPNWDLIRSLINKRYTDYYADRVVMVARIDWYKKHRNWADYTKCFVEYVDRFGGTYEPDKFFILNNNAWQIFQYSNDVQELNKALTWSSQAILLNPESTYFDTYANILYKLNRRSEAIIWQEIAAKQHPEDTLFATTLEMMRKGQPTWPDISLEIKSQ